MVDLSKDVDLALQPLKYISNTTVPMATKLGRVVTCNEELPLIKSHDPSITWSREVMPFTLDQCAPNMVKW